MRKNLYILNFTVSRVSASFHKYILYAKKSKKFLSVFNVTETSTVFDIDGDLVKSVSFYFSFILAFVILILLIKT